MLSSLGPTGTLQPGPAVRADGMALLGPALCFRRFPCDLTRAAWVVCFLRNIFKGERCRLCRLHNKAIACPEPLKTGQDAQRPAPSYLGR